MEWISVSVNCAGLHFVQDRLEYDFKRSGWTGNLLNESLELLNGHIYIYIYSKIYRFYL